MKKHTKIVASISDRRCDVDFIAKLYEAGMNVVRMNTAHADREGSERIIDNVRTVSNKIAILMDTKGPEVRTTACAEPIPYSIGDKVKVVGNPDQETTRDCISVSYTGFVNDVRVGGDVLIDDGDLALKVIEKTDCELLCEVQNEATLGSRKSVNVPGVRINLPSLTEKDRNNILFAIEKDIDFIAHSFVRNKQDVLDIQEILDAHNSEIKIIAKIENQEGVDNIDEILEVAYGVMVARGDLGIEVPQEKIPGIQRLLIRKAVEYKKPVIVATQMLHTMIENPRPTRAEVTDIANAVNMRKPTYAEFSLFAYGVVENVSVTGGVTEKVQGRTQHYPELMSALGIEQATGEQYCWSDNIVATDGTFVEQDVANGRGKIYASASNPKAGIFGDDRGGALSGSSCSGWFHPLWLSHWVIGFWFVVDHLELD